MNEDLEINNHLLKADLFAAFKTQLKKDFESSAVNADFVDALPSDFYLIRGSIIHQTGGLFKNGSLLSALLYRVDISELQLKRSQEKNKNLSFEEIVSELIIKRILQKVILKKTFSK
jgi:hypothetical protein